MLKICISEEVVSDPVIAAIGEVFAEHDTTIYLQSPDEEGVIYEVNESIQLKGVNKLPDCDLLFLTTREEINSKGYKVRLCADLSGIDVLSCNTKIEGTEEFFLANCKRVILNQLSSEDSHIFGHISLGMSYYNQTSLLIEQSSGILNGSYISNNDREDDVDMPQIAFNTRFINLYQTSNFCLAEYAIPCFHAAMMQLHQNKPFDLSKHSDLFMLSSHPLPTMEALNEDKVTISPLGEDQRCIYLAFDPLLIETKIIKTFLQNNLDEFVKQI